MRIDLYRIFFPAGFVLGFWGAFVWVLYSANLMEYPGVLHPEIMMGGFLITFVMGFLCTAVPSFTDSFPPTRIELIVSIICVSALFVAQVNSSVFYFRACSFGIFVYLAYFVIRRFLNRRANPPAPFVFVGFGIASGLIGSLIMLLSPFDFISENFFTLGRLFIVQGYILSFVLGIGSKLIPSLLGFTTNVNKIQKKLSAKVYLFVGACFMLTYFMEAFVSSYIGMLLRDLIIMFVAFVSWHIYKLPLRKGVHALGLWISCWFLLLGHVGASLFIDYKIHFMHLFYIGGLSLLTLFVATRVSLSHGGHDTSIEAKSKTLYGVISLFILAALTRFSAGMLPSEYQSHLLYAASVWIIGLVWWAIVFLPKIIFVKSKAH